MIHKVVCKTAGCSNEILQATADRTGGYCMPCVQATAKQEYDEYVHKNRKDYNEFAGISDAVEALKVIHKPRNYDPLVNWIPHPIPTDQLYLGLSDDEVRRLAKYAEGLIGTVRTKEAEQICRCLSAFTNAKIDACLRRLLANRQYRPALAFRRAPADVRDELLAHLEKGVGGLSNSLVRNEILLALAWIGDLAVVEHFAKWRRDRPAWSKSLYIPPEDYSYEAGWELTPEGSRRDLFFSQCFALRRGPSPSPGSFRAVHQRTDKCPWCSFALTNLFEVELASIAGFDGIGGQGRFIIPTCEVCTGFGTIYSTVDDYGQSVWSPINDRPDYLPGKIESWGRLPQDCLHIAEVRSPMHAADQFLPTRFSQLGGHPAWVQDSAYPKCPNCSQTMMFFAQLDHQDIEDDEGTYFAFVCTECRTTATNYQQT